jgi:DNA-binding beta-propeller fold protein YncE
MTRFARGLCAAISFALATGTPLPAQVAPTGTVIVSNMDAQSVWLIDLATGEARGVIPARAAPHEVAVSSDGRTVVVTNYGAPGAGNLLQFIDLAEGVLLDELTIEGHERLHGVAFLPGDSLLALTSERTSEVLIVGRTDGVPRRTLGTGGGAPHMLALGGPWIWAANITGGSVARMDPAGRTDTRTWPAGTRTEGLATTPDGREGWTGSMDSGTVVGIDGESGEVIASVTGLGVPYRLAVTPDARTVVVSDPEREALVLIERASGTIRTQVDLAAATQAAGLGSTPSPQGFALTPDGAWALVSTKGIDRVALVHLASGRVARFLTTGAGPDGIAFSPVVVAR